MAQTDPKSVYQAGFEDGYDRAMTETRQTVNELTNRVEQDREEYRADLKTLRAKVDAHAAKIEQMRKTTDPKAAYLTGILDGFKLARAETMEEAEALIAEINEGPDVAARVRAALAQLRELDNAVETEPAPTPRLN
jgi:uncharacterized coiled-coil DUF342 family protein